MIRIYGGEARGRILKGPRGKNFRPTQGRIREYIFSVLGDAVFNAKVLDLFSGSGALGLEALSRGADSVFFIENVYAHVQIIKQNATILNYKIRTHVWRSDVFKAAGALQREGHVFHLIFADPPYADGRHQDIVQMVSQHQLLDDQGWLIVEHDKEDRADILSTLKIVKVKAFGQTMVSIYE